MYETLAASLAAAVMMQQVRPDLPLTAPPAVSVAALPVAPMKPASPVVAKDTRTGQPVTKRGLGPSDYTYTMPAGVTSREVVYFSDGIACYAKIFLPKGFDPAAKAGAPAVVLGQGWAGTHVSIEKYAARFAERGLVAMAIDYRGWGNSEGYPRLLAPVSLAGGMERDESRHKVVKNATVWTKRTRLLPRDQQEDYRNAISFIQGEPGVDPERIGVWGSSFAGGNSLAVGPSRSLGAKSDAKESPSFQ